MEKGKVERREKHEWEKSEKTSAPTFADMLIIIFSNLKV